MFVLTFVQQLILMLVGRLIFGVKYFSAPVAVLLVAAALSLWAAALGLLIGTVSRKEDHVVLFSLIAMLVFSALGGAWFPLDIAGEAFATVGHFTPTAWALDGYQNVVLRRLSLQSVLVPCGVVAAYALLFFVPAVAFLKYE